MGSRARSPRWRGRVLAGVAALVVAASVGTAGAQAADPIVYTVDPPLQLTLPGTQVQITFTVSDVPPCADGDITTLDTLDFALSDPSGLSTIDTFSVSEPPGTFVSNFSPDMETLTILFDSAFPCDNAAGPPPATTESISALVTLNVPAGVPLGTLLSLEGDARGFASPPDDDYLAERMGFVLVAETPPPPPPPPPPPTDGENGSPGDGAAPSGGAGTVSARTPTAVAATAVRATARFAG